MRDLCAHRQPHYTHFFVDLNSRFPTKTRYIRSVRNLRCLKSSRVWKTLKYGFMRRLIPPSTNTKVSSHCFWAVFRLSQMSRTKVQKADQSENDPTTWKLYLGAKMCQILRYRITVWILWYNSTQATKLVCTGDKICATCQEDFTYDGRACEQACPLLCQAPFRATHPLKMLKPASQWMIKVRPQKIQLSTSCIIWW